MQRLTVFVGKFVNLIHCFDYLEFFKNTRTKTFISFLFLFIPPAIFCGVWVFLEREELRPFTDMFVQGKTLTLESQEQRGQLKDLTDALYNFEKTLPETQGSFSAMKNGENGERQTGVPIDFRSQVSKKFAEQLGVLSYLPYYRVCLINRNIFLEDGKTVTDQPLVGALAINQDDGYHFYAVPGTDDCKDVILERFLNGTSTIEIGYAVRVHTLPEDQEKEALGKPYDVVIATTSVTTSQSKITISLSGWAILLAYLLVLFAWSFVFFQAIKIIHFFTGKAS